MYHLRLNRGLSYNGIVSATAKNPDVYTEDEAVYTAALASGYFEEVGGDPAERPDTVDFEEAGDLTGGDPAEEEPSEMASELTKMTISELRAYAEIKGIALEPNMKKTDIIEAIKAAEDKADKIRKSFREEA